jgi:hypothetical protein
VQLITRRSSVPHAALGARSTHDHNLRRGKHQVSGEVCRIEQPFGRALMAYLLLIRLGHHEMGPGRSWSMSQLQQAFRLRLSTKQVEHHVKTRLTKSRKAS